ncbi:MAG: M12 family metallo-peptidase [Bacteroidota bacterium]
MKNTKLLLCFFILCFKFSLFAQSNQLYPTPLYDLNINQIISQANNNQMSLRLPFPNGEWQTIAAKATVLLSEEMQITHPDIRTFDLNYNGWKGKLTIGNGQLYARFRTPNGMLAILPSDLVDGKYKSYYGTKDPEFDRSEFEGCDEGETVDFGSATNRPNNSEAKSETGFSRGGVLTTYRLAVVATGEFEDANGGNSMARITSTVQSWNLIYEVDFGIRISLVNTRIYNDPATDPFDPNGDSRVNQAAEVVAMNFADNTYDIGHVFHNTNNSNGWFGGGVAGIRVVCSNSTFFSTSSSYEPNNDGLSGPNKAAAWSGSFNNTGNGWVQLSAHELGHQFGASHTFNGSGSNCSGGNLSQGSAYEIGSGSTIMSYNGICGSGQNIPDGGAADNYFHAHSIDQILTYITTGGGSNCGTDANINNTIPTVSANPNNGNYTIPARTPFELTGSATDPNNDALTYCWEQYDEDGVGAPTQGKIGAQAASDPLAPLFRSFPPSTIPTRVFPRLSAILAGNNNGRTFEALPTVDRSMTFAFTVRDNNPLGGSVVCESIEIDVEDTGNGYQLTSQNTPTTLFFDGSSSFNVTWNVAGTTGGNIQCSQVDILFSTDGGQTFPTVLANNTPNDGSQSIQIPNVNTTTGRIKIKATNNIFFDINNAPITITSDCEANGVTFSPDNPVTANQGSAALNLNLSPNFNTPISNFSGTLATSDPASNLAFSSAGNCSGPSNSNNYDAFEFVVTQSGSYTFNRSGVFGQLLNIYQGTFNPNNVCQGWLGSTARRSGTSGSVTLFNSVSLNLNVNTTYTLVMSTFSTNNSYYGNYNVTYSGPGQLEEEGAPDSGFPYTYIIVDQSNNNIVAFENDPDLRNYAAGTYVVYGFSRAASRTVNNLNNTYGGSPLSTLQSDINNGNICGDLSDNTKTVPINGNGGGNTTNNNQTYSGQTVTIQVCGTLNATSNIINGSDITFIATDAIVLKPGFNVQAGSEFEASLQNLNCGAEEDIEARTTVEKSAKLTIFPNPFIDIVHWKIDTEEVIEQAYLYDQLGKPVKRWRLPESTLDLSDLPNGVYYLIVEGERSRFQEKLIKQ